MKGIVQSFMHPKPTRALIASSVATVTVVGGVLYSAPAQAKQANPITTNARNSQVRIQANAQTLPAFGGGSAAADSGEEKSFRVLTVKHIPARGVAYLFQDTEVIPTEIFVMPAGGGMGGMGGGMMGGMGGGMMGGMGGGMMGGMMGGMGGGMMGGMGGMGGGMMGGMGGMGGFGGGGMGGFGGGGFGGGGFGGGGFGGGFGR